MNLKHLSGRMVRPLPVVLCVAAAVFISSCGKDEEGVPSRLIIDGTTFKLTKGYILGYGVEEDDNGNTGSLYEVLFTSANVTFDGNDLSGIGQVLYMSLFSRSTIELAAGTYDKRDTFLEGSVLDAFAVDGNFSTGTGSGYLINSGTLTISKSGNSWVFRFEFTASAGSGGSVEVKGSFSGALEEVE